LDVEHFEDFYIGALNSKEVLTRISQIGTDLTCENSGDRAHGA